MLQQRITLGNSTHTTNKDIILRAGDKIKAYIVGIGEFVAYVRAITKDRIVINHCKMLRAERLAPLYHAIPDPSPSLPISVFDDIEVLVKAPF
jgi:hypothetical protein